LEISIQSQLICLAFSLIFGIAAAALYGLFGFVGMLLGITQNKGKNKFERISFEIIQFLLDIVYFIAVTVSFQILLYAFDFGRFRLAYLISGLVGFVFYSVTIGVVLTKISTKAVCFIRKTVNAAFYYLFWPFRTVLKFISYRIGALVNLYIIKPYRRYVRRKYKKKVRMIMETELSELVKFDVEGRI